MADASTPTKKNNSKRQTIQLSIDTNATTTTSSPAAEAPQKKSKKKEKVQLLESGSLQEEMPASPASTTPSTPTSTGKKKKKVAVFPVARIKRIMQSDEDVGKIANSVPVMVCMLNNVLYNFYIIFSTLCGIVFA